MDEQKKHDAEIKLGVIEDVVKILKEEIKRSISELPCHYDPHIGDDIIDDVEAADRILGLNNRIARRIVAYRKEIEQNADN